MHHRALIPAFHILVAEVTTQALIVYSASRTPSERRYQVQSFAYNVSNIVSISCLLATMLISLIVPRRQLYYYYFSHIRMYIIRVWFVYN